MQIKIIILDILRNSQNPLKTSEIRAVLGEHISSRIIRRNLEKLHNEGLVNILGAYKGRRYEAVIETQTEVNDAVEHTFFSASSLAILSQLKIPLYKREPCTYNQNWIASYIPNQTYYLTTEQRKQLLVHGRQTNDMQPAGTYAHKIYERLLVDLSYNSSRLEGNTYSLAETRNLLLLGKSATDKLDSEKVMILNHKDAIKFLVDNINRLTINVETIGTLHYLLSDGLVLPEYSGRVRTEAAKVSGSVYMPYDNPDKLQEILQIICNKAQQIVDPFEQSVFLLIHLSYLQAYIDVNKRIARLASNIPLIKNNLVPIAFNYVNVDDYRSAMIAIYEYNQVGPLLELYVWSYIRTAKEYAISIKSMGIDELKIKYRTQRRSLISEIVKNQITENVNKYIKEYAINKDIPAIDIEKFTSDCLLDLHNLDNINSAGLGISKLELQQWLAKRA